MSCSFFLYSVRHRLTSPSFPYTTLFRSEHFETRNRRAVVAARDHVLRAPSQPVGRLRCAWSCVDRGARRLPSRTGSANSEDCERSEEHTSELQSPDHLVCRLLLEKKNEQ